MKIGFLGDFFPTSTSGSIEISDDLLTDYKKSTILSILKNNNFNIVNLECPITNSNNLILKSGPSVKASYDSIELLNIGNIKVASLANNHIKDFSEKGIDDTIDICSKNNIKTLGAGTQNNHLLKSIILNQNSIKVGIISIAESEYNAWDDNCGTSSFDIIDIYREIELLKLKVNHIIIFSHGGDEHDHYPNRHIRKMYRFLADLGVTAIIGHHPHCLQGYEIYNNVPIFYSIGNFFFPQNRGFEQANYGILVNFVFNDRTSDFEIFHFKQCYTNYRVDLLEKEELDRQSNLFSEISKVILVDDLIEKKWNKALENRIYSYTKSLLPINKFLFSILKKIGLLKFILNKQFLLVLLNNIRTKTRRENLISIIKRLLTDKKK